MFMDYYILKDGEAVKASSFYEYLEFFNSKERFLALEENEEFYVSTVFLGISHGKDRNGQPLLFETLYNSNLSLFKVGDTIVRYSSKEEALLNHNKIVQELTGLGQSKINKE